LPPTEFASVSTQTDNVAIQTDNNTLQKELSVHIDDDGLHEVVTMQTDCDKPKQEVESALCEEKYNENFIPLIVKHKQVFKDMTG